MPYRPAPPCSCPGCPECAGRCPNLAERGRCEACATEKQRELDARPRTGIAVYRTRRWKATRRTVLGAHPWCVADGCTELATDVDHIVPLRRWDGDPYDLNNLQPLCRRCHSRKTLREVTRG